jgi:hypothetical protein
MKKRLQVVLSNEAWQAIETLSKKANEGFEAGHINYSDAINEMVLNANVDVDKLRKQHTDLRRSLRVLASKPDLDVESVLQCIEGLKPKPKRKRRKKSPEEVVECPQT